MRLILRLRVVLMLAALVACACSPMASVPNTGKYVNTSTGQEFWLRKDNMFPPTSMPSQTYRAVLVTAR